MELFSIACETCNSRLKVRSLAAIGQILSCPKCGSMVQVTPPDGWTHKAAEVSRPADSPARQKPATAPTQADARPSNSRPSNSRPSDAHQNEACQIEPCPGDSNENHARPRQPSSADSAVTSQSLANEALANEALANEAEGSSAGSGAPGQVSSAGNQPADSAASGPQLHPPQSLQAAPVDPLRWQRWLIFSVASLVGLFVLVVFWWITRPSDDSSNRVADAPGDTQPITENNSEPPSREPPAQSSPHKPETASPDSGVGSPSPAQPTDAVQASDSAANLPGLDPLRGQVPAVPQQAQPNDPQPEPRGVSQDPTAEIPEKKPSQSPPGEPSNRADESPEVASRGGDDGVGVNTPLPIAGASEQPEARPLVAGVPLAQIDVEARLEDPVASLRFDKSPLSAVVEFFSLLSTVPMSLDAEGLAESGSNPNDPVSLRLSNTTVGEAVRAVAEQQGLVVVVEDQHVLLTTSQRLHGLIRRRSFPAGDLLMATPPEGLSPAEQLERFIGRVVAPNSWEDASSKRSAPPGPSAEVGAVSVTAGGALQLRHHISVLKDVEELLAKLRLARRMTPPATLRNGYQLATRSSLASELLLTPVTANFRNEPLSKILDYLERKSGLTLLVNAQSLATLGMTPETPFTLSAKEAEPLEIALTRLLRPYQLTFRIIDGQTAEVTSEAASQNHRELEAYNLRGIVPEKATADELLSKLVAQITPQDWKAGRAGAAIDPQSTWLFLWHNQSSQQRVQAWLDTFRAPDEQKGEPENPQDPAADGTP